MIAVLCVLAVLLVSVIVIIILVFKFCKHLLPKRRTKVTKVKPMDEKIGVNEETLPPLPTPC